MNAQNITINTDDATIEVGPLVIHRITLTPVDKKATLVSKNDFITYADFKATLTLRSGIESSPTHFFYPLQTISEMVEELDEVEKETILGCEEFGNGKYIYHIHRLATKGLMSLTPVPELQMISVYRLNTLGLSVRQWLRHTKEFGYV